MADNILISQIYDLFMQKSDLLYRFVAMQNEYYNIPRDYGSGIFLSAAEIHTLKSIENDPGITVTELAAAGRKTKGAVSQVVKKLEQKGYVFRKRCPIDGKRALLHVSEEGSRLSLLYKKFNANDLRNTLDILLEKSSIEEVDAFFSVIAVYIDILEKEIDQAAS